MTDTMPLDDLLHATKKVHNKMHVVLYELEGFEETDWSKMLDLAEQLCELSLAIKERTEREYDDANWGKTRPLGRVLAEMFGKEDSHGSAENGSPAPPEKQSYQK
jgi:hypothetical protein